jgi:hypothetical protein
VCIGAEELLSTREPTQAQWFKITKQKCTKSRSKGNVAAGKAARNALKSQWYRKEQDNTYVLVSMLHLCLLLWHIYWPPLVVSRNLKRTLYVPSIAGEAGAHIPQVVRCTPSICDDDEDNTQVATWKAG